MKFSTSNRVSNFTFSRPIEAPGLNVDLAHVLQVQARDAAERASADAAFAQAMASFAATISGAANARAAPAVQQAPTGSTATQSPKPPAPIINCITTGNITTCK